MNYSCLQICHRVDGLRQRECLYVALLFVPPALLLCVLAPARFYIPGLPRSIISHVPPVLPHALCVYIEGFPLFLSHSASISIIHKCLPLTLVHLARPPVRFGDPKKAENSLSQKMHAHLSVQLPKPWQKRGRPATFTVFGEAPSQRAFTSCVRQPAGRESGLNRRFH